MRLGCDFAAASLGLENARQRDELAGYSRISSVKRLLNFKPAAPSRLRMARAVRPCLPITRPRSFGANGEFEHGLSALFDLIDRDLRRIIDQSFRNLLDQDPHVPSWFAHGWIPQRDPVKCGGVYRAAQTGSGNRSGEPAPAGTRSC